MLSQSNSLYEHFRITNIKKVIVNVTLSYFFLQCKFQAIFIIDKHFSNISLFFM